MIAKWLFQAYNKSIFQVHIMYGLDASVRTLIAILAFDSVIHLGCSS